MHSSLARLAHRKYVDSELSNANANGNASSVTPGHWSLASALGLGRKCERQGVCVIMNRIINISHRTHRNVTPSHRRLHGRETRPRLRHWQMCRWERSMVERTGGPGLRCIIGSMYVLRPSSAHCTDWVAPGPWMTSAANKVRHRSCERFHALRRWDDGIRVEGRAHASAPSRQTTDQYPIPWVHCTNTHDEHALLLLRLDVRICANGPPGVCPSHGGSRR